MNREVLVNHFAGCLLGFAIGDALAAPAEGLTPYETLVKYKFLDGFYASNGNAPGAYSVETVCLGISAASIIKNGKLDVTVCQSAAQEITEKYPTEKGRKGYIGSLIPVALTASVKGMSNKELGALCRPFGEARGLSKTEILSGFLYVAVLKDVIRNREYLTKPSELYDSDKSLLSEMIALTVKTEKFFDPSDPRFDTSEKLSFLQKKLGSKLCDPIRFVGMMGQRESVIDLVCKAFYCFFRTPDEFSTVCNVASMGGLAQATASMTGGLIGAYIGATPIPEGLRINVQNGPKIETIATRLADLFASAAEQKALARVEEVQAERIAIEKECPDE
jgi:ADP-ribosylglycohydrolase